MPFFALVQTLLLFRKHSQNSNASVARTFGDYKSSTMCSPVGSSASRIPESNALSPKSVATHTRRAQTTLQASKSPEVSESLGVPGAMVMKAQRRASPRSPRLLVHPLRAGGTFQRNPEKGALEKESLKRARKGPRNAKASEMQPGCQDLLLPSIPLKKPQ